uniref:Uncharacterized protein n=1 Tax=Coccidioides posadasii RMSCC 3488 TaxID=454284 RepID=A0A0J6FHR4_COCPO|nr:hypothetical protein CPAG_05237 [Coccidioides posadasii RMSCC 3488]
MSGIVALGSSAGGAEGKGHASDAAWCRGAESGKDIVVCRLFSQQSLLSLLLWESLLKHDFSSLARQGISTLMLTSGESQGVTTGVWRREQEFSFKANSPLILTPSQHA